MTVLEYVEVFLEMAAWSSSGNTARWLVIASVQLIKLDASCYTQLMYNVHVLLQVFDPCCKLYIESV